MMTFYYINYSNYSAPGSSLISYDHLKHACEFSCTLLEKICTYFNLVLNGTAQLLVELKASRLIALEKQGGGVRPIAIGESLTRLLACCVFNRLKREAAKYLEKFQWGIGVVDGAASAVHALETLLYNQPDSVAVMLDFSNAFNAVNRTSIFQSLLNSSIPGFLPSFYSMYHQPSKLLFNSNSIDSASGVKQGDPLGPLFFCMALHSILKEFTERYPQVSIVAYMDYKRIIIQI
ncbi:hypothetical protein RCL1_003084 [Eukaryota sp. TZLM3-RCL]